MTTAELQSSKAQASVLLEDNADTELRDILQRSFRPRSNEAAESVQGAVKTLLNLARKNRVLVHEDVAQTIEQMVAELDKKISAQLTEVMHNPRFQRLEAAWRGLHYLASNTDTNANLKIRVLNISKAELGRTLRRFKGVVWDQSPIFKKIYEQEYGQFGGEPFGCLVGGYEFDHSPQDVGLLLLDPRLAGLGRQGLGRDCHAARGPGGAGDLCRRRSGPSAGHRHRLQRRQPHALRPAQRHPLHRHRQPLAQARQGPARQPAHLR
jgi:predicted component of type VI protein secretion system